MSSFRLILIGGSLLVHGGLVAALGNIRAESASVSTAIDITESVKKETPPPPPAEVNPPPPQEDPAPRPRTVKAAAAPPPDVAPTNPSPGLSNLPDLGLELSGGNGPGLAVPAAAAAAPVQKAAPVTKTFEKAAAKPVDTCDEPPAKPKLINLPQPAYTDDARSAGIEGKVRVEVTVDEEGKVVGVRVLSSLGHGLDEAALAAAKGASFQPAMRCGRASRATFTIAIRFSAS